MSRSDERMKTVPNAKFKLICMCISIILMIFSVTQVYYLTLYTLGKEVSEEKMSVYSWVVKLVNYKETSETVTEEQDAYENE